MVIRCLFLLLISEEHNESDNGTPDIIFRVMKNNKKMKAITITALIFCLNIACSSDESDLRHWPSGTSPREIGKRITERYLETPHTQYGNVWSDLHPVQITYPDACTWLGGLWFASSTDDDGLYDKLKDRFAPLFDADKNMLPKPDHVDNNVFGAVPLEFYIQNEKNKYLDLGLLYADSQWSAPDSLPAEAAAWFSKGYTWQTRLWIDDMFMITAVQTQAYRATGDRRYIDMAAREMLLYLDTLQLDNGLFYHSPEAPFCWGRGNGWMAAGMTELLRAMPADHPDREKIMSGYMKMMATLLRYQAEDGMWRQVIDDPSFWKETSSTAMFTYAFITGVRNGWLDKQSYGSAARRAWLSLVTYIDADDNLTEVCEGTGTSTDRDHYMNRKRITGDLHGQAPLLWCAAALLR